MKNIPGRARFNSSMSVISDEILKDKKKEYSYSDLSSMRAKKGFAKKKKELLAEYRILDNICGLCTIECYVSASYQPSQEKLDKRQSYIDQREDCIKQILAIVS